MARYFSLPDGTYVEIPEGMDTEVARKIALGRFAGTRGIPKEAATKGSDLGSALTSGIANTLGIVPGIYGLLGGSYENAPLAGTVKSMREYAAKTETPETTYKKYLIDQAIADASKQGGVSGEALETLKQLAINPRITGLKLVELIPDVLAAFGTGGFGAAAGKAAVKTFAKEAGEEAIKRGATRGAGIAAVGTSAAQEGTSTGQEVYDETLRLLEKKGITGPEAIARAESAARAATVKQGLTVAALGAVLPGAEKSLLGVGKGGIRRTALGEAAEEGGTGISGQLIQNIAAGEIDPSIALSRGVGRAGVEGTVLGGLAGAGAGAFSRRPTAPEAKPADPVVDAAVKGLVESGDVKPDEVVEADAAARIADIRKSRAEAEKKAEEQQAKDAEDLAKAEQEVKEKTTAATAVTPTEQAAPAATEEDQLRAVETAGTTITPPPADTTDGTQAAQTQQAEAQGQEPQAPAAAAATTAAPEVKPEEEVPVGEGEKVAPAAAPAAPTVDLSPLEQRVKDANNKVTEIENKLAAPSLKPPQRKILEPQLETALTEYRKALSELNAAKTGATSGTVPQAGGASIPVVGGTGGDTTATGTGAPATGGVGQTGVDAGKPAGGTAGKPGALKEKQPTDTQQRVAFGTALGASQAYPGSLRGRRDNRAVGTAVREGNFSKLLDALEKSKNKVVAEIARRARGLKTSVKVDDGAFEQPEGGGNASRAATIDYAKIRIALLDSVRDYVKTAQTYEGSDNNPVAPIEIPIYERGEVVAKKPITDFSVQGEINWLSSQRKGDRPVRTNADMRELLANLEKDIGDEQAVRTTASAPYSTFSAAGKYDLDADAVLVPNYHAQDEGVLAHEIVHAQTVAAIKNPTAKQRPVVERINKLYEHVRKQFETDEYPPYGTANVYEFVAEGLSNPDFQYKLSRIQYENTSAWGKFTQYIADLLGLKNDNAFTELLTLYSDLTESGQKSEKPQKGKAVKAKPTEEKTVGEKTKRDAEAIAREAEQRLEEKRLAEEADENAPVSTAYEKLDLADLEAKAVEVKSAPLAKAGEKISTRASLKTFDVNIPFDQARLEEKIAEVRKLPEKTLTKAQRAIRWYAAYVEANRGAVKDIPLYLAHNKADSTLAATGPAKQYLQPAVTWLNSNLGGTASNNINAAAVGIRERLKKVESQRTESEAGAEKRTGGRKVKEETVEEKPATFEERLKKIAASEKKDAVRAVIAEKILQLGANPSIIEGRIENGSPAGFDPRRNVIVFDPQNIKPGMDLDALFMHEATHAVIDHVIDNEKKLNQSQKAALARLKSLYREAYIALGSDFKIDSLKEFAAEAFSNPDFQTALKKQKSPITPFNIFNSFARAIARLLGINVEGNAFVDTVNTLENLISVPTKSVRGKEVSYAPADKKYVTIGNKRVEVETGTPEPTKKPKREKTPEQKAKQEAKEAAKAELAKNLINVPLSKYDKAVRWAQNLRRSVLLLEEELRKKNLLTPDLALNTEMTLEGAESAARQKERVQPLIDKYQTTIQSLAKKMGKDPEEVVDQLERYYIALTEPERRVTKFFEKATLTEEGERKRKLLFTAIVSNDAELKKLKKGAEPADAKEVALIPDSMTVADAKKIYKAIEEIVLNDPEGALQNIDSSAFQTAGFRDDEGNSIPMTSDMSATIRKETEDYLKQNPEIGDLYQQAQNIQRDLEAVTREMNREAGYGSPQLERLIAARQWKNYVPLRGKPDEANQDPLQYEDFENEERVSGAMVQTEAPTKGRKSAAENVIFRAFAEANRAAARPSRSKVTQVVKNLVEKGYVAGEINPGKMKGEPSTFAQRFIDNKKLDRADNLVYHYREDGLVDVIMISNKEMARAIRNVYPNSNRAIDTLNKLTSAMGQMLTRYNPAFWAKNFLADVLTNSFVISAEHGKGAKYVWQVVSDLVDNKLTAKGMNFIRLYEAGKTDELNKLAEKDSWYKDAQEYVREGGKISQLSGLSTAKQQEATYNALGPGRIVRSKQQLDRLITPITDGLELAARVSAFRTYRALDTYKNNPRGAVAASKNLANFENIGQQGRLLGALFMFFRPSATGAVRAIDALKKGKYGKYTAIAAFGMGALIHNLAQALSDDDEEGRNRIATDDPDRWVRNWRFYIPGFKDPIQIPWGFGIGMLASFGAQVSMKMHGTSSWSQLFSNSLSAAKEGFAPLPFSQISPTEHPFQFLVDTAAPSAARPLLQYAMNLDSLNREIFNQSFNRYSPMYVTKENMPESLNQFSKAFYDSWVSATGSPPPFEQLLSPAGISFFMNNYLSAVYKLVGTGDDVLRSMFFDGQKDFDPVKASMVLGSFKGTPANYDLRKYKEFEQDMNKISSVVKTFEKRGDEDSLDKYYEKFPGREDALKFFNKQKNGELKKLQQEAGAISREYADRPAERKKLLEENRKEQNEVMRYIMTEAKEMLAGN